jgi:recombination protein RecT
MSDQTAVAVRPETGIERIKNYMLSPEVKERFSDMMGTDGIYYLNQVMIVVAGSQDLQRCEPTSILVAAMRAASLKLSVDPARGEAWIIPYKDKATFQLGYRGVYELAMRTNQYRFINVAGVYEGETITEDRMTGMHSITGSQTSTKVIAWMLYFKLFSGFEKTFVMTVKEIEEHARHYSQAYSSTKSKWNDPVERPKMERKTVLVNGLRKWGRFNAGDKEIVESIETEQGWHENIPDENTVTVEPNELKEKSNDELLGMMGVEPEPVSHEIPEPKKERDFTKPGDPSLEEAEAIIGKDGVKYGDCTNEVLRGKAIGHSKNLNKKLGSKEQDAELIKLRACNLIINTREGKLPL